MNDLHIDVFTRIAAYLDKETLSALKLWYGPLIKKTLENSLYWYEKSQYFLKSNLKWQNIDWKSYYKYLVGANKHSYFMGIDSIITASISYLKDPIAKNVVSILLEAGYDPTTDQYKASSHGINNNSLITAIKEGNFETAKLLIIDGRIDPSALNNKALIKISKYKPWNVHNVYINYINKDNGLRPLSLLI
jgi:hypothetical protein